MGGAEDADHKDALLAAAPPRGVAAGTSGRFAATVVAAASIAALVVVAADAVRRRPVWQQPAAPRTALFSASGGLVLGSALPPPPIGPPPLWDTSATNAPLESSPSLASLAEVPTEPPPAERIDETEAPASSSTTRSGHGERQPHSAAKRRGSFLVLGDWGFDVGLHGNVMGDTCQKSIAQLMLDKFEELGDVRFIINVGDSFYPEGLKGKDDPQWDTKWRNVYDAKLRSVPWYSVYGNHDYHHDPCACSSDPKDCAQVNWDIDDLSRFYMPGHSWYKTHEDLELEVVALDLNKYMEGWDGSKAPHELKFEDCQWTRCPGDCFANADTRAEQAFDLFRQRFESSTARNLLVFSHYPTDYLNSAPAFLANLSNASQHDILYLGGHRHNVDNTTTRPILPNRNWVVGGGGGWGCDGSSQGFLVGTVGEDYRVDTYAELVSHDVCCPPLPPPPSTTTQSSPPRDIPTIV